MTKALVAALACVALGAGRNAAAQWGIGIELQRVAFSRSAVDTSATGGETTLRPGDAASFGFRVDRRFGRFGAGVLVRYAGAALVASRQDVSVVERGDFHLLELAPELCFRFGATATGATGHVYLGPVLGIWSLVDADRRIVTGVRAGVGGGFPLSGRLAIWLRAGAGLTGSVFVDGDLPPEAERQATRRGEIALGLRYGR